MLRIESIKKSINDIKQLIKENYDLYQSKDKINKNMWDAVVAFCSMALIFGIPYILVNIFHHNIEKYFVNMCVYLSIIFILLSVSITIYNYYISNRLPKIKKIQVILYFILIILVTITAVFFIPIILLMLFLQYLSNENAKSISLFVIGGASVVIIIVLYVISGLIAIKLYTCLILGILNNIFNFKNMKLDFEFIEICIICNIIIFIADFIYRTFAIGLILKYFNISNDKHAKNYLKNVVLAKFKYFALVTFFFITASGLEFKKINNSLINAVTFATLVILVKDKSKEIKHDKDKSDCSTSKD